jgi:hypothetical protein
MQVYLQWARRNPSDYIPIGSESWVTQPTKGDMQTSEPVPDSTLNQQPGWVCDLSVQGVSFGGSDHYHVADLGNGSGGVVITIWNDNPAYSPPGNRQASVWTILPLAPDDRFGGALNTRQSRVVYADTERYGTIWDPDNLPENTVLRPWSEFVPPLSADVRHGIWMSDAKFDQHIAARTIHGWREWAT